MKRIGVVIFLYLSFNGTAQQQPCKRYTDAMDKGNSFIRASVPVYDSALKYFLKAQIAAKECGIRTDTPTIKIRELFKKITGERDKATQAQKQTKKARVISLVNAASGLKKTDPTIGRSLAAAAYNILPSHLTASVLHDYLSDTLLNVYTRLQSNFRSPFALNDSEQMVYATDGQFVQYSLENNSSNTNYLGSAYNSFYVDDMSADANICVGHGISGAGTQEVSLKLYFRQSGRLKQLTVLDRSVSSMKLSSNGNAVVVNFFDSSFSVYDTSGNKMVEYKNRKRNLPMNFSISKNGRYVAYTTEWAPVNIKFMDCSSRDTTREDSVSITNFSGFAFSNSVEEELWVAHGDGICAVSMDYRLSQDKCYTIGPSMKYITPFNKSEKWAAATVDNTIVLLDHLGKPIDQLFLDPSKKILDMRVSSEDSSLLISLLEDKPVVWKFKRPSDHVRTIELPHIGQVFPISVLEKNQMLGTQFNFGENLKPSVKIVICNENFETTQVLDSQVVQQLETPKYINYSAKYRKLIVVLRKQIRIKDLAPNGHADIIYDIPDHGNQYPAYSVSNNFATITSIQNTTATIYSTDTKKKPSTIKFNVNGGWVYGWNGKFLVYHYPQPDYYSYPSLDVFSASGKKERLFTPTESYGYSPNAGSTSGSSLVYTIRYGNGANIIEIYTEEGYKLKTYWNIPTGYTSITIDEKNGYLYVMTTNNIYEYKLPKFLLYELPPITIADKLRYQIPGVLEELLKNRNIIPLAEGARFCLQNYHKLLDEEDLAHFKSLVSQMPEASKRPDIRSFDAWLVLKRLQEELRAYPKEHETEALIINDLILKFNN